MASRTDVTEWADRGSDDPGAAWALAEMADMLEQAAGVLETYVAVVDSQFHNEPAHRWLREWRGEGVSE